MAAWLDPNQMKKVRRSFISLDEWEGRLPSSPDSILVPQLCNRGCAPVSCMLLTSSNRMQVFRSISTCKQISVTRRY